MTAPLKQKRQVDNVNLPTNGHPLDGLNWIPLWETRAAGELFAAVRAYCGLPPVVGPHPTDDEVQQELASARAILEPLESSDLNKASDNVAGFRECHGRSDTTTDRAASSTVEALTHSLRCRGVAALNEPDTRRRLGQLSEQQLHHVAGRLERLKIVRAWSADEVMRLVEAWVACHDR